MAEQPRHRVAFLRRPVFGEILEPESYDETAPKPIRALQQELEAGLSRLPRTG